MWKFRKQRPVPPCAATTTFPTDFSPRIESFGSVHCAVDHDLANVSMFAVEGGYVAIDAGSGPETITPIVHQFEQIAGGPLKGLIYTHSHGDHICGADAFQLDDVPIWAQQDFLDTFEDTQLLPNAYFIRGAKLFGYALPKEQVLSNGIGPPLQFGAGPGPKLRLPTHTFADRAEVDFCGTAVELHSAPGETNDHLFAWLPEQRVLFAGDNIYKSFPNLYSMRGVPPRPVRRWIDSLDAMRRLSPRPELLVLGHTSSVEGADRIYQLLTDYRDAIAYVHDSVVRGINAGKSPDQLAVEIRLPAQLAEHPYLREHYGTIAASVRGIYTGYIGWFDGDAANMDPIRNEEIADWISHELGDKKQLLSRIDQAIERGQLRKALWLTQILQAKSANWRPAKQAKARILELLAGQNQNPLERSWQLTEVALLRKERELPSKPKINGDTIAEMPIERIFGLLASRLNPKTSAGTNMSLGFDITDLNKQFTFFIRQGVGELAPALIGPPDLTVRATESDLKRIFLVGDVPPLKKEFWDKLEFVVPENGILAPIGKLRRLATIARLFLLP